MVIAKYPGFCPKCKTRFNVGEDEIVKDTTGKGWVHLTCPKRMSYQTSRQPAAINEPMSIDADVLSDALADETAAATEQFKEVIYSKYQQDFFDNLLSMVAKKTTFKHIVVEAVAGSGKTFTLLEGVKKLIAEFPKISIRIIAFNKPIANEFEKKLRAKLGDCDAHASTMHSLALSSIRAISPKLKVDSGGEKLGCIFDEFWPVSKQDLKSGKITKSERKDNFTKRLSMRSVIAICKATLTDGSDPDKVLELIEHYGIEVDQDFLTEIVSRVADVLNKCKENLDLVDFDDMVWLPIVLDLKPEQYDIVMGDEGQDFSNANIILIQKFVKPDGHIVIVGDRNQSLYGFRGADTNAIPNIIKVLDAKTLPLSVTYRCPTSHVDLARKYVPQLEARNDAPVGNIQDVMLWDLAPKLQQGDMVICRTNAPLIQPAFECIRLGKKAVIRGQDIGAALTNLIKRFETDDLGQFEIALSEYFQREFSKLLDKGKEMQAVLLKDKVETLQFIVNEVSTVSELIARIETLFSDKETGIVFSSIHRAKGLEAENVYILRQDLLPHPKATKLWEAEQEQNGIYVGYTRSKENLYFVKGGESI